MKPTPDTSTGQAPSDPTDPRFEAALAYGARGWKVLPLYEPHVNGGCTCPRHTKCESVGKHPRTKSGLHAATDDEAQIRRWWRDSPHANIGLRCGSVEDDDGSGIWALDFDSPKALEELEALLGPLGGLRQRTARGVHLLYRVDRENYPQTSPSGIAPGIDIRSRNAYIVVEPSIHATGVEYLLDDGEPPPAPLALCEWIAERLGDRPRVDGDGREEIPAEPLDDASLDRLARALDLIPADDYTTWLTVGMALHFHGVERSAWDAWSHKSSKFNEAVQARKWRSFHRRADGVKVGSIFHLAKKLAPPPVFGVEPDASFDVLDPGPFPVDDVLDGFTGPLAETVQWTRNRMRRDEPIIAMASALGLFSAALGRRIIGPAETKPNLGIIVLAPSGRGKENARSAVGDTLTKWRESLRVPVSYTAPYHRVQFEEQLFFGEGQLLCLYDEFGPTLREWTAPRTAQGSNSVSPCVRTLLSIGRAHYGLVRLGRGNALRREEPRVREMWDSGLFSPSLTILGYATPGSFFGALSNESLTDGLLGRFLVLSTADGPAPENKEPAASEPPATLDHWLGALASLPLPSPSGVPFNLDGVNGEERAVPWGGDGAERFKEAIRELDREADALEARGLEVPAALIRRVPGMVAQLSLVLACAEAPDLRDPGVSIDERHVASALLIARWSACHVGARVAHGVADDLVSKAYAIVKDRLRKAAAKGVAKSKLFRGAPLVHADRLIRMFPFDPEIRANDDSPPTRFWLRS